MSAPPPPGSKHLKRPGVVALTQDNDVHLGFVDPMEHVMSIQANYDIINICPKISEFFYHFFHKNKE